MDWTGYSRTALAAALAAALLATGCGTATHQRTPASASALTTAANPQPKSIPRTPTTTPTATPTTGSHGRGGSGHGSSPAAAVLPADWPPDIPVPQGTISGSTGSAGRWTVLILATGSARDVLRATAAFYQAAGFTAVTASILNKGKRQITIVAENRDHSPTETNLVIGLTMM